MTKIENAIQTSALSFSFGKEEPLVDRMDLSVPKGSIFGILGRNGAGKSTLMKLLLGLIRPQFGEIKLLGVRPDRGGRRLFRRVGALIEEPQLYPHLSGCDNLRVMAAYRQIPLNRIDELLDRVGLESASSKLVRHYSTGMKQRLGIAMALLPDPELLLLDEPTNGLDPTGIVEIRQLIHGLHEASRKTILLSSHLLGEVEQVCSHLAILHQGKLLFQGSLQEMKALNRRKIRCRIETDHVERAVEVLNNQGFKAEKLKERWILVNMPEREAVVAIIDVLRRSAIAIFQIIEDKNSLEDHFLELFKKER